jgi:hypothetical protein
MMGEEHASHHFGSGVKPGHEIDVFAASLVPPIAAEVVAAARLSP